MYIIKSGTADDVRENTINKYTELVQKMGGTVENVDKIGNKKFAYTIDYKNEGFYVLMNYAAMPTLPLEMERQMRISDDIVRFMTINKAGMNEITPKKLPPPPPKELTPEELEAKAEKERLKAERKAAREAAKVSETEKNTTETDFETQPKVESNNTQETSKIEPIIETKPE